MATTLRNAANRTLIFFIGSRRIMLSAGESVEVDAPRDQLVDTVFVKAGWVEVVGAPPAKPEPKKARANKKARKKGAPNVTKQPNNNAGDS
jgi:hypothetical protein